MPGSRAHLLFDLVVVDPVLERQRSRLQVPHRLRARAGGGGGGGRGERRERRREKRRRDGAGARPRDARAPGRTGSSPGCPCRWRCTRRTCAGEDSCSPTTPGSGPPPRRSRGEPPSRHARLLRLKERRPGATTTTRRSNLANRIVQGGQSGVTATTRLTSGSLFRALFAARRTHAKPATGAATHRSSPHARARATEGAPRLRTRARTFSSRPPLGSRVAKFRVPRHRLTAHRSIFAALGFPTTSHAPPRFTPRSCATRRRSRAAAPATGATATRSTWA